MTQFYPKTLVHPAARKGRSRAVQNGNRPNGEPIFDYYGDPDVFPPIDVYNPDQEAMYRAKGYLEYGEKGTTQMEYVEFPKILSHPDYEAAIPDMRDARKNEHGHIEEFTIKGRPERNGPVTVKNRAEQDAWEAKGWGEPVKSDPEAYAKAFASPFDPSRVFSEYPKMVDGVVVNDPNAPSGFVEFPKWVGDTVVQNAAEEDRERKRQGLTPMATPEKVTALAHDPALDVLIQRATKAGIDVQEGWTADQILDAIMAVPAVSAEAPKPKNKGGRPRKNPLPDAPPLE